MIDLITCPRFDQSSLGTLLLGLYPATQVPSHLICKIVNSLGQGDRKPAPSTQNRLLKWVILVKDVLEDPAILVALYSVLFNLLDTMSLRAHLCHLLSVVTQRKHVKPFRVQMLLELYRRFGSEPALLGLLRIYQEYSPDAILGDSAPGKAARFECPDPDWRDRLRHVQEANLRMAEIAQSEASTFRVIRRGVKRSRATIIPEVHTFHASESATTLEEIDGSYGFIENLDTVALPSQLVSALDDPLLRKLLVLRRDDTSTDRIDQWLSVFSDAELQQEERCGALSGALTEVLEKILSYTQYSKSPLRSVQSFLNAYLKRWNGKDHRNLIFGLLSYVPLHDFQDLKATMLNKLESAVLDSTAESAASLLEFYTTLLRQWTVTLLASSDKPQSSLTESTTAFAALVDHASLLSLSILASHTPTQATISKVLSYHESLAHSISFATTHPQIRILVPSTYTIYLLIFLHPSLSSLSRISSILATYKQTFEAAMANPPPGSTQEYPRTYVNHFNGFLMDVCNLLWRSRAFNAADTNALGCLMPPSTLPALRSYADTLTPPHTLATMFSLSHHPSLSALSGAAFRELEDVAVETLQTRVVRTRHAGPVTQKSLEALYMNGGVQIGWGDYRLEVLKWLGERGIGGIGELMFCTMKQLMPKGAPA
ncbi:hypothetical protein MMC19_000462 [Ptychographa xylographoides]|nr:hypothetical protein [Ptychographa xylographoides]